MSAPVATLQRLVRERVDPAVPRRVRAGLALLFLLAGVDATYRFAGVTQAIGAGTRVHVPWDASIPMLGLGALPWLGAAWLVGLACFAAGWHARVGAAMLFAAFTVMHAVDQSMYANQAYLVWHILLLCMVADLSSRRPVPRWPLALLALVPVLVYGFTALSKLNPQYLSGATIADRVFSPDSLLTVPAAWRTPAFFAINAVGVLFVEVALVVCLVTPRLRRFAYWIGVPFQLSVLFVMPWGLLFTVAYLQLGVALVSLYPLWSLTPAAERSQSA